jgi:hypothetical protein
LLALLGVAEKHKRLRIKRSAPINPRERKGRADEILPHAETVRP